MKLIEKMAEKSLELYPCYEDDSEGDATCYLSGYDDGFRAAREMAAKLSDDYSPDDTDGHLGLLIRSIGESEVE